MQLKDYIQGNRRGKDANRLEREAMSDPFLQDALDGFDAVAGNHAQIIERLETKFAQPAIAPRRGRRLFLYWSAAASVLLLVGFSIYFLLERKENIMPAIAMLQPEETEQVVHDDSSMPESTQMEEPQQEMPTIARVTQHVAPAPTKQLKAIELDEILDVAEADVIVADELIVAEFAVEESENENSAKVMAMKEETQTIHEKKDDEEVVVVGYGTQRRSAVTSSASKSEAAPRSFGEKEFQDYCQQNGNKNVCDGKGATVRVTFFIDEKGKPTEIEYQRYTCEEAKTEMENLLSSSPAWTKTNQKVTITVRW